MPHATRQMLHACLPALTIAMGLAGCTPAPKTQPAQLPAEEQTQTAPSHDASTQPANTERILGLPAISDPENILLNPGFEAGLAGWIWLDWSKGWAPFKLSTTHAYEGHQSLHLPLASRDERSTVVWGGVQEPILTDDIPECIEGFYYVENWASGDWKQYLQLVIIDRSHNLGQNQGQAQLRYIISGVTTPPLPIGNAQYLFIEDPPRNTPQIGTWTHFSANPRADFLKHWQYIPTKDAQLRVLFEVRFDQHHVNHPPARADVYFDNLYMGPKTNTRCAK